MHHAEICGRAPVEGEAVGGPGQDRALLVGEGIAVLAVERVAVRIDAVLFPGNLHRAAQPAFAADKRGHQVTTAIITGQVCLLVGLAAFADVPFDQVVEREEFGVSRFLSARGERSGNASGGLEAADRFSGAKQQGVAALSECGEQYEIAGIGRFERFSE